MQLPRGLTAKALHTAQRNGVGQEETERKPHSRQLQKVKRARICARRLRHRSCATAIAGGFGLLVQGAFVERVTKHHHYGQHHRSPKCCAP